MEEDLDKVEMQTLLDEMRVLTLKYEKLRDENKFNIFPILRRSHEEVPLHSRFIFELLNPEGTHREGDKFLNLFLEIIKNRHLEILGPEKFKTVGIQNFKRSGVQVRKEHQDIDILITNNQKQAIIIENKLRAGDQPEQLQRYYEQMENQGSQEIWLIYLSLDGHKPSENSLGNLSKDVKEALITISYSCDILEWLEKCIEKSSRKPALRETIIQYENLIKEITGKTMSGEQGKKVYDLLAKGENIHSANTILLNWDHVRWYLERDFWEAFEKIISKEYQILDSGRWSYDKLDSVIHSGKNKTRYGILFELFSKGEDKFCLFIVRGWNNLYYGVMFFRNEEEGWGPTEDYPRFTEELNKFTGSINDHEYLGYKGSKQRVDFEHLTPETLELITPETLNLINEKKRDESLKNIWAEIKEFIEQVKKIKAEVLDKST